MVTGMRGSWSHHHSQQQRAMNARTPLSFSRTPAHGMVAATVKEYLPTAVNQIWTTVPHRHAYRLVFWVTLELSKLSVRINHHIVPVQL